MIIVQCSDAFNVWITKKVTMVFSSSLPGHQLCGLLQVGDQVRPVLLLPQPGRDHLGAGDERDALVLVGLGVGVACSLTSLPSKEPMQVSPILWPPPSSRVWHWLQALLKIFFPLSADIFLPPPAALIVCPLASKYQSKGDLELSVTSALSEKLEACTCGYFLHCTALSNAFCVQTCEGTAESIHGVVYGCKDNRWF